MKIKKLKKCKIKNDKIMKMMNKQKLMKMKIKMKMNNNKKRKKKKKRNLSYPFKTLIVINHYFYLILKTNSENFAIFYINIRSSINSYY